MKTKLTAVSVITMIVAASLFYSCTKDSLTSMPGNSTQTGKGGSLARFTISGDYLYTVDNHYLNAFSLAKPSAPAKVYTSPVNFDIETIYPFEKYLFLGTKTGLYIYSIEKPQSPVLVGEAKHARSCDPVVANDSVAFVTLKGSGGCGPAISGLYIHEIKDINNPSLMATVPLPDPLGLGLQDSVLYVCCGKAGLKVFNVSDPYSPVLKDTKSDAEYIDVIPYNGILIVFVRKGILLYDISNPIKPEIIKELVN
jgi:hypothetical protein